MRRSLKLVFTGALVGAVLWVAPVAASQPPVWWGYHWQQPGTAAVATPDVEPAFVPLPAVQGFENPAAAATYVWVQPGTAQRTAPFAQPPAWVNPTFGCTWSE